MAKVTKCNLNHTASSRKTCFNLHLPGLKSSKSFIHADIFRSKNSDKFKYIILIWRQAKVASEFFRDSASSKRILIQAMTDPLSFLANCRCTRMKLITQALQVAEAFYRYIYIYMPRTSYYYQRTRLLQQKCNRMPCTPKRSKNSEPCLLDFWCADTHTQISKYHANIPWIVENSRAQAPLSQWLDEWQDVLWPLQEPLALRSFRISAQVFSSPICNLNSRSWRHIDDSMFWYGPMHSRRNTAAIFVSNSFVASFSMHNLRTWSIPIWSVDGCGSLSGSGATCAWRCLDLDLTQLPAAN